MEDEGLEEEKKRVVMMMGLPDLLRTCPRYIVILPTIQLAGRASFLPRSSYSSQNVCSPGDGGRMQQVGEQYGRPMKVSDHGGMSTKRICDYCR